MRPMFKLLLLPPVYRALLRFLPLAQENSGVDIVQPNVITNQPSTVQLAGPTGVGEQIGHASCIDRGMYWILA